MPRLSTLRLNLENGVRFHIEYYDVSGETTIARDRSRTDALLRLAIAIPSLNRLHYRPRYVGGYECLPKWAQFNVSRDARGEVDLIFAGHAKASFC